MKLPRPNINNEAKLCAAAMSLSLMSTPIREPISLTICLGLSWGVIGTPVISKQSLLK